MLIVESIKVVNMANPLGNRFSSNQLLIGKMANAKKIPQVNGMKIKLPYHKIK